MRSLTNANSAPKPSLGRALCYITSKCTSVIGRSSAPAVQSLSSEVKTVQLTCEHMRGTDLTNACSVTKHLLKNIYLSATCEYTNARCPTSASVVPYPLVEVRNDTAHSNTHGCETCSKTFNTLRNLTEHVQRHMGERSVKCKQCPKAFAVRGDLTQHIQKHERQQNAMS